ncbi:ABC transporter permease subunit [Xylophilus ampelinus]|uniref:General L-amino acid transport system permease protein n=1 Tax=Xylophilus ampelinus TaxID=54067 RepID=A0A318SIC4_9BURK|nr:ABC transporter permease subunit [Xylophilus ampelinus]MCS4509768.1 ABC transporter permease subunit [Xylophilus ampelinus]PYE78704.1 general L-amino acid transport system permease protein [Xylophilus ampelinus]
MNRMPRATVWAWTAQLLLLAVLLASVSVLVGHAFDVLRARGIRSGFDFLLQPAGFEVGEGWLDYSAGQPFWRAFLAGLINTVRAAVPAAVLALLLGTLLGIGRLAPHLLVRGIGTAYVEALRNVPLLVQLLMLYFALTQLLPDASDAAQPLPGIWISKSGLSLPWPVTEAGRWWPHAIEWPERTVFNVSGGASLTPEYLAIVWALGFYTAAFVAEIVRAGIGSVSDGQNDAARAMGFTPFQQLQVVVLPQALRVIVPALTNQLLSLVKNSSLAVAVGYPELVSVSNTSLNSTGRAFECIAVVMAVYLLLSLLISAGMNLYNRRVALRGWS